MGHQAVNLQPGLPGLIVKGKKIGLGVPLSQDNLSAAFPQRPSADSERPHLGGRSPES